MKKVLFFLVILMSFVYSSCEKTNEPELSTEKLTFQDLRVVHDNNLKLEDVVDLVDTIKHPGYSFYQGHTNVLYNNKQLKTFAWVQYNSPGAVKTPIFWAKSNSIYIFTGNTSAFELSTEIYVIDGGVFKTVPMLENDTISAIVPHQIKSASINFIERLISIKCDPNSGLAGYGVKEATGIFKY